MALLENDPANPCFGCGPQNPLGLRLAFERVGDEVRAAFAPTHAHQGWPGRLHSGVLYTAMLEVANWTVYGLLGRIGVPARTSALDARRWVAIDERLVLVGRRAPEEGVVVAVEARDAEGRVVAALTRGYALPTRAEFLARMGYDDVPAGFEGALPEA